MPRELLECRVSTPKCWGPVQWLAIHQLLRGYPRNPMPSTQAALKAYLAALAHLIPCSICASHWADIAPTVDTSSRAAALKWSIDVHNEVNKRLKKPVLSYAEAVATLEAACPPPPPPDVLAALKTQRSVLIAIAVILLVAMILLAVVVGMQHKGRGGTPSA